MRGSPSIDHSLPAGVSAQTAVKMLSGWSGEIRGEIAVKLSLAALPLRTRPDFETSRALYGLAQNSAHSELTPNFAAQAAAKLLLGWYGNAKRFGLGDRDILRRLNISTCFLNDS
ncbi:hypothetical protein ACFQHW_01095 [Lapidilactobacillus achengensis]|uniref:Uncharacterized protein n=1 Tax=Lapidilactobacillus achengensis TaxID=2486000 RepID=A0ABW1ULT8_9LACO|nr:hypothetical protein [Lapidilactobacillus achengensis]